MYSHSQNSLEGYNQVVSRVARIPSLSRRQLAIRVSAILLTAVVMIVGLWGVAHADDMDMNATTQVSLAMDAAPTVALDDPTGNGDVMVSAPVVEIVTCILGMLCGLALAALLALTIRFRLTRSRRLLPLPDPIVSSPEFERSGKHRFGLLDLNLLRI